MKKNEHLEDTQFYKELEILKDISGEKRFHEKWKSSIGVKDDKKSLDTSDKQ